MLGKKTEREFKSEDVTEIAAAVTACRMTGVEHKIYKTKHGDWKLKYTTSDMVEKKIQEFMSLYREIKKQLV